MVGKLPAFDYSTCMACGSCGQACPFNCIASSKYDVDAYKKPYPILILASRCTGCGICQKCCPVECINISG